MTSDPETQSPPLHDEESSIVVTGMPLHLCRWNGRYERLARNQFRLQGSWARADFRKLADKWQFCPDEKYAVVTNRSLLGSWIFFRVDKDLPQNNWLRNFLICMVGACFGTAIASSFICS